MGTVAQPGSTRDCREPRALGGEESRVRMGTAREDECSDGQARLALDLKCY